MNVSLITISSWGLEWKTMRGGGIVAGRIGPSVPRDQTGDYMYGYSQVEFPAASHGLPFSDLPDFFNAAPKLEKFFRVLVRKELTARWFGLALRKPVIAVHPIGYSRPIHLGEKTSLKDWVFRWGAHSVIICDWPTPYPDSVVREILTGEVLKKEPRKARLPEPKTCS
jgi:hypothetical protein